MPTQHPSSTEIPSIGLEQIQLLEKLSNACGVSGDEGEVRKIVLEQIQDCADEITIDAMGNVLAVRKSKTQDPLRVMVAAHMDEIGFMLVKDDGNCQFQFEIVGGIDPRQVVGKTVWIGKEHAPGVIGSRPIHLTDSEERKRAVSISDLRIDLGVKNDKSIEPGDRAAFATKFFQNRGSLFGKALDDRIGVATLIELLKHAPPNIELLAAFTVQEEVGLRGALVAAYSLKPDMAIALDSTPANDMPAWDGKENTRYNARLGEGPALYIADRSTISDPRIIEHFVKSAKENHIPYQFRQAGGGSTDAGSIHRQREGIPSLSVSVPGRYAHTTTMLVRLEDWQNTFKLIYSGLSDISPELFKTPR